MVNKRHQPGSRFFPTTFLIAISGLAVVSSCKGKPEFYSFNDFEKVPKTDVHLHINTLDRRYMELASKNNFRVVSPNVDSRISLDEQLNVAGSIKKEWPGQFTFFGTFPVDSFGTAGFAENTIARINECMKAGASGIKIWKNIGMVLKDKKGSYVMVDDPAFNPVFRYMEENKIPVMGHLGEPRNCWLPLEKMTDTSNYRYYKSNPEYHMYLHPEAPSYNDQINARDHLLNLHPELYFIGSHLASLEWSVEEIAERMDIYPNLNMDMSARVAHLQYQSIADRELVRNFMIKYQDRIFYGTDITINANEADPEAKSQLLLNRWISNWIYLATDSTILIKNIKGEIKGLKLPASVVNKIYNQNAERFFSKENK
ncbi:MAG: amidohydrolase family protein [Bacteroidales bacterium]